MKIIAIYIKKGYVKKRRSSFYVIQKFKLFSVFYFTYAALAGIPVHPQQGRWSGHEHGRHRGSYNVETVNDTYSSI